MFNPCIQQVLPGHLLEGESHPIPGVKVNPVNHQKLAEEDHLDDGDDYIGERDGDDDHGVGGMLSKTF